MKLNKKRGVSDVVTTVLMILLVIAAIGILWVVIQRFVTQGTNTVPSQADCISTTLTIGSASASTVTVSRTGTSNAVISEVKIFVDGSLRTTTAGSPPGVGETKSYTLSSAVTAGQKVTVAAKIGDTTCNPSQEFTAT